MLWKCHAFWDGFTVKHNKFDRVIGCDGSRGFIENRTILILCSVFKTFSWCLLLQIARDNFYTYTGFNFGLRQTKEMSCERIFSATSFNNPTSILRAIQIDRTHGYQMKIALRSLHGGLTVRLFFMPTDVDCVDVGVWM